MERTFTMVKPDGVKKNLIGEVIRRYESNGLVVQYLQKRTLTRDEASEFYGVHADKPFFPELVDFITSGPVVAIVLEGSDAIKRTREIMGATNPEEADPGTIRADFATVITENIVHGSDAPETAKIEAEFFFGSGAANVS